MNMVDLANLRYRDIQGDKLTYIRRKTVRTTRHDQRPIVVMITEPIRQILARWGVPRQSGDEYVFGILPQGVDEQRERELVQNLTKTVNKWMKRIAAEIGLEKPITTYYARHSFATVLKRSGAPIEFISESLGHQNLQTTESYLDSFEDSVKQQYAAALTAFGTQRKKDE